MSNIFTLANNDKDNTVSQLMTLLFEYKKLHHTEEAYSNKTLYLLSDSIIEDFQPLFIDVRHNYLIMKPFFDNIEKKNLINDFKSLTSDDEFNKLKSLILFEQLKQTLLQPYKLDTLVKI